MRLQLNVVTGYLFLSTLCTVQILLIQPLRYEMKNAVMSKTQWGNFVKFLTSKSKTYFTNMSAAILYHQSAKWLVQQNKTPENHLQ